MVTENQRTNLKDNVYLLITRLFYGKSISAVLINTQEADVPIKDVNTLVKKLLPGYHIQRDPVRAKGDE